MTTGAQTFNSPLWSYDPSAALLVRAGPGTLHACLPNNLCKLLHSQCGMPPSTEPSIPPCLLLLQAAAGCLLLCSAACCCCYCATAGLIGRAGAPECC